MRRSKLKIALLPLMLLVAGLLLAPPAVEAHHGWVDFDEKSEITLDGSVTAFYFVNPHCVIELDVKDQKGQIRKWQGEFASKIELSRKGWNAASLEAGDKVTLTGHPAKDGALAVHVIKIKVSNGEFKPGLDDSAR